MTTPFLLTLHDKIFRSKSLFARARMRQLNSNLETQKPEVIICGFGRVGQIIAYVLGTRKIPYVALDLDVGAVMVGRERGFNVFFGDSTNSSVLREFGLGTRRVRAVVIALDNTSTARNAVSTIKGIAPKVKIFARARNLPESRALVHEGVTEAWPETVESSLMLAHGVLERLGVSDEIISHTLQEMRDQNYSELDNAITDKNN